MKTSHTLSFYVSLHDTGPGGIIKIPSIFNCFQTLAAAHTNTIGFGGVDVLAKGYTWVISRYRLSILRLPSLFEKFTATTWRFGEINHYAIREFLVKDHKDNIIIKGTSSWILLNTAKREPVTPSRLFPDYPLIQERALEENFASIPKISRPDKEKEFSVRLNDLDMNRHVNNSIYASWILETGEDMNEGKKPVDISLNFRGETHYGQTVISQAERNEKENIIIHKLMCKDTGKELTRGTTSWE
ncbi:MAG: acyl-ACP thioesterase domain-containing protein [Spirochaetota bacterium]